MNHLRVAYACDNGYIMQTGISIISLLESNVGFKEISVYLISIDITDENISKIRLICERYNRNLIVIPFQDIAWDLELTNTGRHSKSIYAKIFFARIEGLDRILYIDSDTIIDGSLRDLWNTSLEGYYMGMVETFTGEKAKRELSMPLTSPFFNDGVALCNVDYCRRNNLIGKCLEVISAYNGNPPVLSEGTLNKVGIGHILPISPKYNMMSGLYQLIDLDIKFAASKLIYDENTLRDSFSKPVIIHYLSGFYNRPWNIGCTHPLRSRFKYYQGLSDWCYYPATKSPLSFRLQIIGLLLKFLGPKKIETLRRFLKKII